MRDNAFHRLIQIMATLRSPEGCPWDREQTPESLIPYLAEEACEVIEALTGDDPDAICEELGDLLLQVVFLARIFEERGSFSIEDVVTSINQKLERRHPHVFGDHPTIHCPDEQSILWDKIKQQEKLNKKSPR
ncbi:MAG: MazG nucleotide pyrophosphohydrolase domain-containing protein [Desulfuromonadales bacterium]|nr:MazG nucleotide pyrophosphohydrolase domain-containing protein [Desulfuromonadales bacterium]MDT8422350.1 MazG nucleotide pyrophosphohydrolase domain-containing protein [Desulfuromonadales bacterium]